MAKYLDLNGLETVWGKVTDKITESKADWNQNDETADDYVKNRTHWVEQKEVPIVTNYTMSFNDNNGYYMATIPRTSLDLSTITPSYISGQDAWLIYAGDVCTVIWDGVEYTCTASIFQGPTQYTVIQFGNSAVVGMGDYGAIEPFYITTFSVNTQNIFNIGCATLPSDLSITISRNGETVYKLDNKFLNFSMDDVLNSTLNIQNGASTGSLRQITSTEESSNYSMGVGAAAFGYNTTASGYQSHAEGYNTKASGQASHAEGISTTASNSYSHAEGYTTTASGQGSHAEGTNTTASGDYSHAEGSWTEANKTMSHAEGSNTLASGPVSHAEGAETTASGQVSHAEGSGTTASGNYSHAEGINTTASGLASYAGGGNTTASGDYSHAEGSYTTASNHYSHAEGLATHATGTSAHAEGLNSLASSSYQHVQGKNNVEDASSKYAHIVGNGTDTNNRSNAHTLDWDGNAWFQGNVYVGGTGQTDTAAAVLKPVAYNLLDNSDFRSGHVIAQAGLNGLHGSTIYVCDRWVSWNQEAIFSDGYITPGSVIDQYIDPEIIDLNATYTAAICLADGTIKSECGTFAAGFGSYELGIYCPAVTTVPYVRLNSNINIRWAALYEGAYTINNLPEYQPKGYAAEYMECRRYYQQLDGYALGNGYTTDGNDIVLTINTGIQMRTVPTFVNSGELHIKIDGTDTIVTARNVLMGDRGNAAMVRISCGYISGNVTFHSGAAFYTTGTAALSADLYL